MDHQLAQFFERCVLADGDDARARRHHFAHGLIAERDHGLDQLAVAFFDDAFFFAGGDQGLDVFLGRGGFVGLRVIAADRTRDCRNSSAQVSGRISSAITRKSGTSGSKPCPRALAIDDLRNDVGADDGIRTPPAGRRPSAPPSPGVLRGEGQSQAAEHGQAEMLHQRKRQRAEFGFQADLGFERGLEKFQRGQLPGADAQGFQIQHLNAWWPASPGSRRMRVQDQEQQRHRLAFLRRSAR